MAENFGQILSQQRLHRPGIVNAYAEIVRLIQHVQDLGRAHLPAFVPPVLAKAAAQVAGSIYAM